METTQNNKSKNKNKISNITKNNNNILSTTKDLTKPKIVNSRKNNEEKTFIKINKSDERPIKSIGKYNLNFIDWNNEWERVNEVLLKIEEGEEVKDKEEERRIINCVNKEREKNGIFVHNFELILKPDIKKECYICLKNFSLKKKVRKLTCKHMFCEECLLPWIKYNSKCPVCKFDFKEEKYKKDNKDINEVEFDYEINAAVDI